MDFIDFTKKLNQQFRDDCAFSNSNQPWFGHFTIDTETKVLTFKIGEKRFDKRRIIDWRHPIANGYFKMQPGEDFDLEDFHNNKNAPERYQQIEGEILDRTSLESKSRSIISATIKTTEEEQRLVTEGDQFILLSELSDQDRFIAGLPDVRALLSKEQYQLITESSLKPVVIQGQAGSGKTTVALYRLSWLIYPKSDQPSVNPKNVLIVMFNKALQSFVSSTLGTLGLQSSKVSTFHAWALEEVKRAYNGDIQIDLTSYPHKATAVAIKKQMGLLSALDAFVERQIVRLKQWLKIKLEFYDALVWLERLDEMDQPIVQRLISLRGRVLTERKLANSHEKYFLDEVYQIFVMAVKRMTQYKEELLNFLSDTQLLQKHLPQVPGQQLQDLVEFQRKLQLQIQGVWKPGPHISFEDLALLLRLIQLKHGGFNDKEHEDYVNLYDHLVIDEAQDFGALEMTVLLSAVRTRSGLTIVGDINQKIIPEVEFMGWDQLVRELGIEGAKVSKLEVPHRSTAPIMDLANSVINEPPSTGRSGLKPELTIIEEPEKLTMVTETVHSMLSRSKNQHICIVCRHVKEAKELFEELNMDESRVPVRLGHNKQFEFTAGVTITNLLQIKGLEFDSVILMDPSEQNYPNNVQGCKHLYTAITRAKEQLHMIGSCTPTPILNSSIKGSILLINQKGNS